MPVKPAGMRIEPPPSVPTASAPMPVASAAAAPPEEPPGVLSGFQGLRVMPVRSQSVTPFQPNSGVAVLPSRTAPCSRSRAETGESSSSGAESVAWLPKRAGQPLVRMMSLIEVGTPSMRLFGAWMRQRSSAASASANAPSRSTTTKALSLGLMAIQRGKTGLRHLDRRQFAAAEQGGHFMGG